MIAQISLCCSYNDKSIQFYSDGNLALKKNIYIKKKPLKKKTQSASFEKSGGGAQDLRRIAWISNGIGKHLVCHVRGFKVRKEIWQS